MDYKTKITDVSNISEISSTGRYRVTWREDGTFHSKSSSDRSEIERYYNTLMTESGLHADSENKTGKLLAPIENCEPGPKLFKKLTADIVKASHKAVNAGDLVALKRLKEYSGIISTLSKSYQPWSETQKTIEEFEQLINYHESVEKMSLREGTFGEESQDRENVKTSLETNTGSEKQIFATGD